MVTALHEKGVKIIPWTVNEEKDAARLLKIGVDGIITDYPDLADKFRNNP
jgi:glycerophosphoryl diester phosphodiesterase